MTTPAAHSLSREEIARFSRQLMLKGIGPAGQERLRGTKALIVGAGGLGCPVSMYLVAAGIGRLGIVDHDVVSIDNLHRQTMHDQQRVGQSKADSLKESLLRINKEADVVAYNMLLTSKNVLQLLDDYDIVADCSDNAATRYLINDACVLSGKPLVFGSALGWEGQFTVYNNGPNCPCYRCIFPVPPRPEHVMSCSEAGVLGPVVGVIGSLQALEIIKIAVHGHSSFAGNLWMFDGFEGTSKKISLREKMANCAICGANPQIKELQDYKKFCGSDPSDKVRSLNLLSPEKRTSPREYSNLRGKGVGTAILLDVRPPTEFDICRLPEAKNFPWEELKRAKVEAIMDKLNNTENHNKGSPVINGTSADARTKVFVVCHHGNDSQLAARHLNERLADAGVADRFTVRDIVGGLDGWALEVDTDFPRY
uniref:Adenylyltransferase and sulfurtransferase MOCS3 homolog n=1 Tax=Globodera pallida TaxID=36090 RepID=A0A183BUD8_GLOPA